MDLNQISLSLEKVCNQYRGIVNIPIPFIPQGVMFQPYSLTPTFCARVGFWQVANILETLLDALHACAYQNQNNGDNTITYTCGHRIHSIQLPNQKKIYLGWIYNSAPCILLTQMIGGWNGLWTDDCLWGCLLFLRQFTELKRQRRWMHIPVRFWEEVYAHRYNSFSINGKEYYSTWWQWRKGNYTDGYRNCITNALFLVLTMRLLELDVRVEGLKPHVARELFEFLSLLFVNGLFMDGLVEIGTSLCPAGNTYSYLQGVVMYGIFLYYRYSKDPRARLLLQTLLTTLTSMPNPLVNGKGILGFSGDSAQVLSNTSNVAGDSFNGIFFRYLTRTLEEWKEDKTMLGEQLYDNCIAFIKNNQTWLANNGSRDNTFHNEWCLTQTQTDTLSNQMFTTQNTCSAIDLFLSIYLLETE